MELIGADLGVDFRVFKACWDTSETECLNDVRLYLDLNGDFLQVILRLLPVVIVVLLEGGAIGVDVVSELIQLCVSQPLLLRLDKVSLL